MRSAQRLTVSRPGFASARQRTPSLFRAASGGSPPPLRGAPSFPGWRARREGAQPMIRLAPIPRMPWSPCSASCAGWTRTLVWPLLGSGLLLRPRSLACRMRSSCPPWCHPPVDQLDNLAQFLRERPAQCTVIAPHWPARSWYRELLDLSHRAEVIGLAHDLADPVYLERFDLRPPGRWPLVAFRLGPEVACLRGSRVLEPLVRHPFSVGISLYTLLSPSSLRTCPERCCSIVYYDC